MNEAHKQTVESGYDQMAEHYLATKNPEDPLTLETLENLARNLPPEAHVLDLGCGAGVPAASWLARRFRVTGVDVSAKQLDLARRLVPGATFVKADMMELNFAQETFDAVVAFHSIIHVPRQEHPTLLERINGWLKPGGSFLATLTMTEFEGQDNNWEGWGATMRWSHYDRETNLGMLREAGFDLVYAEPRTGTGTGDQEETWLWVLARKPHPQSTTNESS